MLLEHAYHLIISPIYKVKRTDFFLNSSLEKTGLSTEFLRQHITGKMNLAEPLPLQVAGCMLGIFCIIHPSIHPSNQQ